MDRTVTTVAREPVIARSAPSIRSVADNAACASDVERGYATARRRRQRGGSPPPRPLSHDEKNAAWTAVHSRRTLNRSRPPLALCREYPSQGSRSGRRRETGTAMAFHLCTIQASIVVCDVLGRMSCRSVRG